MTTLTLHPGEIQQLIIDKMKANVPLVAMVGDEVREDNWQGTGFHYPAARVQILMLGPVPGDTGECNPIKSLVRFTVLCYAEGSSSLVCTQLMGLIADALVNTQLQSASIVPVTRVILPEGAHIMPVPDSEDPYRIWRGEVQFMTQLKKVQP